uniref:Uncharacterized protein n=1 Tax=Anguilla anguilla TaxID=7936 RepID=A0A0E9V077_ANGAN
MSRCVLLPKAIRTFNICQLYKVFMSL